MANGTGIVICGLSRINMKRVLIIGGGYGGLRAVESLAKYDDIEITLVDTNPYHYLQTQAYGYIAGKYNIHEIAIDLKTWTNGFDRVRFIQNEISSIDVDEKSIILDKEKLLFDYIVVAVGAKTNFFTFIEGLKENSHGVKRLDRAHNFRNKFETLIYKKLQNEKVCGGGELKIVVGGAGLSGVEVAAEMAYIIKRYSKTIGVHTKEIKIYLIDASETILPGFNKYTIVNTQKRLEKLGVKILTNTFISKVLEKKIIFKDATTLEYCFMVFTGGIKAANFNNTIVCEKNNLNQFIADKYLNIGNKKDIFAIGDCVEIRDKHDSVLPPTAQIAERSAEYIAKAIRAHIDEVRVEKFQMSIMGMFIALGGKYAVGELFGILKVKGYSAYLLKKGITYAYYVGLRLRINTGFKNRIIKGVVNYEK